MKEEPQLKISFFKPSAKVSLAHTKEIVYRQLALAGRLSHDSQTEDNISPEKDIEFVRLLKKLGHWSVFEHVTVSMIVSCDRGISHELVRHRIGAYTQESTRYCDYLKKGFKFIIPIGGASKEALNLWKVAMIRAAEHYRSLKNAGAKNDISRGVLPTSTATKIYVTYNLRMWRHVIIQRTAKDAHPQIRQIMKSAYKNLSGLYPEIFDDIVIED